MKKKGVKKKVKPTVEKDSPKIQRKKYLARRRSIKEGMLASASMSFGSNYVSPFAIAINASSSMVAMLSSITGLLGPLTQMFGSRLIEKYPRKKILARSVFFESLMWLPFILLAILFYLGIALSTLPILLLLFFSFFTINSNLPSPAFFSWIGDLVSGKYRGRFFSKRNLLRGFVSVVVSIAAAFFLDYAQKQGFLMFGFITLFSLALLTRLICVKSLKKQYEPKLKIKKGNYFSFWDFIINARKNNFGRYAIFKSLLNFAASISAPLLAVYLLRNLEFSYIIYIIVIFSGTVFSLVVLELWGKFSDRYGNYRVLSITSLIVPTLPILWILSPSPVYLILIPSLISGVSWAGFNLAESNFAYDNISHEKRGLAISYFRMLNGIGIFLGAGLGALLIKILTIEFIEPIILIFFIGAIARMFVVFTFLPKIKEVKHKHKFHGTRTFKRIIFKQAGPTLHEEIHEIASIPKYFETK